VERREWKRIRARRAPDWERYRPGKRVGRERAEAGERRPGSLAGGRRKPESAAWERGELGTRLVGDAGSAWNTRR